MTIPSNVETNDDVINTFEKLNLIPQLLNRITDLGFHQPTPIQLKAIPTILKGLDLIAGANTGSGKTATFALPILQKLYLEKQAEEFSVKATDAMAKGNHVSHLILVPTRELAQQVGNNINSYAAHFNGAVKIQTVFGGVSVNKQMQALRGGTDILVATPGRLIDLISSNAIKLDLVKTLVLDEADRMLNLGFSEELTALLRKLPSKKQTLLFSATFPEQVENLTKDLLQNPVEIQLQNHESSTLVQRVFTVNKGEKTVVLERLIKQHHWRQVLIFVNAKKHCEYLASKLAKRGISAEVFHGDKGQGQRNRVIDGFKAGEIDVLIATDIAARGLDIAKLPVVINFNLPRSPLDYMHRIGRSGRAGEVGLAISLIDYEDFHQFSVIEKKNKIRLTREELPGFEVTEVGSVYLDSSKPMAKPEGSGKKKKKQK